MGLLVSTADDFTLSSLRGEPGTNLEGTSPEEHTPASPSVRLLSAWDLRDVPGQSRVTH